MIKNEFSDRAEAEKMFDAAVDASCQTIAKPNVSGSASLVEKTCPYCNKKSKFKHIDLKPNEIEVFYCAHCDSLMNGF